MIYLAQLFGFFALVILIISFQSNNKKTLLKYQIFSSLFFAIQYLCLNAITGCLMNLMTMIRNIIYKMFKKTPLLFVSLIIIIMIMKLI